VFERPTSVTVLAIIGIIFGFFGFICAPLGLLSTITQGATTAVPNFQQGFQMQQVDLPGGAQAMMIINGAVSFIAAIILLTGSIASFQMKPIARTAMNTYAILAIVNNLVSVVVQIVIMGPMIQQQMPNNEMSPAATFIGMALGAGCAVLCYSIYPICVLFFYNRRRTAALFETGGVPPEYAGGGYPPAYPPGAEYPGQQGQQQAPWDQPGPWNQQAPWENPPDEYEGPYDDDYGRRE